MSRGGVVKIPFALSKKKLSISELAYKTFMENIGSDDNMTNVIRVVNQKEALPKVTSPKRRVKLKDLDWNNIMRPVRELSECVSCCWRWVTIKSICEKYSRVVKDEKWKEIELTIVDALAKANISNGEMYMILTSMYMYRKDGIASKITLISLMFGH